MVGCYVSILLTTLTLRLVQSLLQRSTGRRTSEAAALTARGRARRAPSPSLSLACKYLVGEPLARDRRGCKRNPTSYNLGRDKTKPGIRTARNTSFPGAAFHEYVFS